MSGREVSAKQIEDGRVYRVVASPQTGQPLTLFALHCRPELVGTGMDPAPPPTGYEMGT